MKLLVLLLSTLGLVSASNHCQCLRPDKITNSGYTKSCCTPGTDGTLLKTGKCYVNTIPFQNGLSIASSETAW
ncbi:hypothetical protein CTRI78_v008988 [Colletotrichum trifolii]|uniref:Uncharacterized protein n=1 Tax=Colletotrichum trifolii TaxID=5466 RepID=A0A4R8QRQ9_COLTR|nr:hypothetical protein CTRI78_v008988 [Colletotrichum trifolii]